jgi:hypothetical protein
MKAKRINVPKFYDKTANWQVCKPNSERILHSSQDSKGCMSGFSIIQALHTSHDFRAALVGVNAMVFGHYIQHNLNFGLQSIT